MIRTSLLLPETLHQRLIMLSRGEGKSVSELARELLDKALSRREAHRNQRVYTTLKALDGIGDDDIKDASTTIDNVLYGEGGVWRGSGQ